MATGFNALNDVSVTGLVNIEADSVASSIIVVDSLFVGGVDISEIVTKVEVNEQNIAILQQKTTGISYSNGTTTIVPTLSVQDLNFTGLINGTISSTELGYLNNVTSNIQTQLNDKASLSGNNNFTGINSFSNDINVYDKVLTIYGGEDQTGAINIVDSGNININGGGSININGTSYINQVASSSTQVINELGRTRLGTNYTSTGSLTPTFTAYDKTTNRQLMILTNSTAGAYNDIVQTGDTVITSVRSGTSDVLTLTNWNTDTTLSKKSGIRITNTGTTITSGSNSIVCGSTLTTLNGKVSQIIGSTRNTIFGAGAYNVGPTTTTMDNTAIGYRALYNINNTNAIRNSAVGYFAGAYITSGAYNTVMGFGTGATLTTESNNILIGRSADITAGNANSIALGYNSKTTASNQIKLGTSVHTTSCDGALEIFGTSNLRNNTFITGDLSIQRPSDRQAGALFMNDIYSTTSGLYTAHYHASNGYTIDNRAPNGIFYVNTRNASSNVRANIQTTYDDVTIRCTNLPTLPISTLPTASDSSNKIPTTQWVQQATIQNNLVSSSNFLASMLEVATGYGVTWVSSNNNNSYTDAAMNSAGNIWVVTSLNSVIKSTDYGTSWNTILNTTTGYQHVAMSALGKYIVVGNKSITSKLKLSTDFGSSFNEVHINSQWTQIGISADGQYIVASPLNSSQLSISNNYGSNFSSYGPTNKYKCVGISSSGQFISAAYFINNDTSTEIIYSHNFGATWVVASIPSGNIIFNSIKMASSGQIQIACSTDTYLYMSYDFGKSWEQKVSQQDWTNVAISATGQFIVAVAYNSKLVVSKDFGASFSIISNTFIDQTGVAISGSGLTILRCIYNNKIFSSRNSVL